MSLEMSFRYCLLVLLIQLCICQARSISKGVPMAENTCTWEQFKNISGDLNKFSVEFHDLSLENITKKERTMSNIPRILCEHHCGPDDLKSDGMVCLKQINHVLHHYDSHLHHVQSTLSTLQKSKMHDIIRKINQLQKCLKKHIHSDHRATRLVPSSTLSRPVNKMFTEMIAWDLTSATSIIARVFSVWKPSSHDK